MAPTYLYVKKYKDNDNEFEEDSENEEKMI